VSAAGLPPRVLRCRAGWRVLHAAAAAALLVLGTDALVASLRDPASDFLTFWTPPVLLAGGAACAWFVARYGFATLTLDDHGFRLEGPLGGAAVGWTEVVGWARVPRRRNPAFLRVLYGEERRRLTVPLIYEDDWILELGIAQRRFPSY
jgi:hypothetical protein